MCRPNAPFSVCASSTVLVPVSWLAGILLLAYFLAIFSTSIAHMGEYPDIFSHTIYSAPWFGMEARADDKPPQLPLLGLGNHSSTHLANFPISLSQGNQSSTSLPRDVEQAPQADIEKPESAQDKTRPWWALQRVYRPGKDQPFAVLSRKGKAKEQQPAQAYRPTSYHGSIVYPERERRLRDQKPLPPYPQITEEMLDPDKPIPLPRLSAWVRADEARGITTRTMPIPSPARAEFVTRQWHNRDDDYDF
ncbi:hypothetical protein EWM64_g1457 [Hericium alpestre]|uniref:Uncharacterized protein n=1 Tax=Hericium alpestre TaxID=135208 RepID=A0A4Z0A8A4_9AGAM|nr:hypothetical protein EWM64_g1457 [Hericium alpestre]